MQNKCNIIATLTMQQQQSSKAGRKLIMRKLQTCNGQEHLPVRWSDMKVTYNDDKEMAEFNLKVKVMKEVSNDFSMKFSFLKCDASGNPDSCEYKIKDYKNNQICNKMVMKKQAWTAFMEHFDKPVKCPIKPGEYHLVKSPIKTDFLRWMPVGDAVWKVNLWGYDKGQPIACVDVEMQLRSVTGRNRG